LHHAARELQLAAVYLYDARSDRYNAAFMAHEEINDWFQPYSEFFFMDDKTHQQWRAALFKDSNPLDPTGAGDYFVNCSNPLLSAQHRDPLHAMQIAADTANPGSRPSSEDWPPQCRGGQSLQSISSTPTTVWS